MQRRLSQTLAVVLAFVLFAAFMPRAAAQTATTPAWPTRTVHIVVGQTPGSSADTIARIVADALSTYWGQSVVVENRSGAGGTIAADLVANAAADGYMLLLGGASNLTVVAATGDRNLRYNPLTDFTPLGRIVSTPFFIGASGSLAAKNVPELVALAKAAPGRITYISYGDGTLSRLAFEALQAAAGIELTEIPYRGTAPALADLLAGRVDLGLFDHALHTQNLEAGRMRALGTIDGKRSAAAPGVPTVAEQGLPGYALEQWYGLVAPNGLPGDVRERLVAALGHVRKSPDVRRRLTQMMYEPMDDTPAQFAAAMRAEIETYTRAAQRRAQAAGKPPATPR